MAGTFYVVATPIGNRGDLSPRALEVLRCVSLVLAEDTRHSGNLLKLEGVQARLLSCHEHNEAERAALVRERLEAGEDVALVTDAGTPAVSDPGYRLLAALRGSGLRVSPIPGPSAALAALSVSGLPSDRFTFLGFPPKAAGKRRAWLAEAATRAETLILYLPPHGLGPIMADLLAAFGDRPATLGRELTKLYEEVRHGGLAELTRRLTDEPVRGEIALVVAGRPEPDVSTAAADDSAETLAELSAAGLTGKRLAQALQARLGLSRNEAYRLALGQGDEG